MFSKGMEIERIKLGSIYKYLKVINQKPIVDKRKGIDTRSYNHLITRDSNITASWVYKMSKYLDNAGLIYTEERGDTRTRRITMTKRGIKMLEIMEEIFNGN